MPLLTTKYGAHVDADFYRQAMAQRASMRPQQSVGPGPNSTNPNFVDADGYTRPGYQPPAVGLQGGSGMGVANPYGYGTGAGSNTVGGTTEDWSGEMAGQPGQLGALQYDNNTAFGQSMAGGSPYSPGTGYDAAYDMVGGQMGGAGVAGAAPSAQPGVGIAPSGQPGATSGGGFPGAANYNIGGALNFGAAGANFDFSGNPAAMSQNYANTYMDALKLNAQNYGNILGGYQQTMQNQLGAQDQLNQNYDALGNKVQGLIAGTDAAQMQRVQDQYNSAMGSMNQGAIDRGLGNTTVTNALSRGVESDRAKAQLDVQNQFAQLQAGYASNIGLAGLNQQGNNILQNTNLSGRQLDFMERVNSPYPNPSLYNQLGQQYGQGQQGAADRGQIQGMLGNLQKAGQQGSGQTGLNSGGGGGVRQSAFGPGFSGGNQSPNFGPSATGGGFSGGANGGGGGGRVPGVGGGGGFGGAGVNAVGGGVMPGGRYPGSPASAGAMSTGGGAYGGYSAGGGYGNGLFGNILGWAGGDSGGSYGGYSGGLFGDILSWAGGSSGSYGDYEGGNGISSLGNYASGGSYGSYGGYSGGLFGDIQSWAGGSMGDYGGSSGGYTMGDYGSMGSYGGYSGGGYTGGGFFGDMIGGFTGGSYGSYGSYGAYY